MKILHIIQSMDSATGGPAEGIRQINSFLEAWGHSTTVISLDDSPDSGVASGGCFVPLGRVWAGPYCPPLEKWLRARIDQFDCIIVHGLWQMAAVVSRVAKGKVPYFVFAHGMLDPWFRKAYPLKHLKKQLYWALFEHRALAGARAVFFTTQEEQDTALNTFWPCSIRSQIVPYGIRSPQIDREASRRAFLNRFPELQGKRLLLFLSRLHFKKGANLALEAFVDALKARESERDSLPFHFLIAGPDENGVRQRLNSFLKKQPLWIRQKVTLSDGLFGELKWGAFASGEVFILPSHQENFGLVVAESLAMKVPVLISNKINIHREINAAGAGWVERDDLAGTRRLIESWISCRDMEAMRERALRCYQLHFDLEKTSGAFVDVLRSLGIAERV